MPIIHIASPTTTSRFLHTDRYMFSDEKPPELPFVRKLCAHLPEDEIQDAEARFMRYVAICMEIAESIRRKEGTADFDRNSVPPYDDKTD